ncbi:FAD-linked oxidoreductase-like protein [Aspergillus cavernicola]|uniref:Proline dehydrogenase n=1 Tax=Aspergillus cavernicola TaxID=176166 RepID=A0ABR4J2I3_9EURO
MHSKILWPKRPQLFTGLRLSSSSSATHHGLLLHASAGKESPLAVLPTRSLIYSVLFTSVISSPLLRPCLGLLKYVIESKSSLLHPSRNPAMRSVLRMTIYNHFCAGENEAEVRRSVTKMKALGFKGVILGYARESIARMNDVKHPATAVNTKQDVLDRAVDEWKEGNLRTLKMIGKGDYLSVKFTGAGPTAVEALTRGDHAPPPRVQIAITEICAAAAAQGSRLWIDAEQQIFQSAIDNWTIDLMRQFNSKGTAVIFNTIQAYLKSSTENVSRHLRLAQTEGWTLGIKLVRGAYIAHDYRSRIHDTKYETDRNYNHIVQSLLTRQSPAGDSPAPHMFPDVCLFVATHNAESVRKAYSLSRYRTQNKLPTIPIELGQLQGMADEVSCELLARNRSSEVAAEHNSGEAAVPGVFKCLAWGSLEECLHFLLRRAIENQSAMERTRHTAVALRKEAWRRWKSRSM